jgi:type I restriction enzyme S subunit
MKNQLPSRWQIKPFSEVAEVVTGTTPPKISPEYYGGSVPFITPTEIGDNGPIREASTYLTASGVKRARLLPVDSVLVTCIGTLGKVGITEQPLVTNQQINSLIFDTNIVFPKFAYFYCKTLKHVLETLAPSTTIAIINKSKFSEIEIPLPPLAEQKRIASILDKADAIRRKRQAAIKLADEFLRATFLDMFGDPVTNPKSWEENRLCEIADIRSGITKGRRLNGHEIVNVPYMRVANVQDGHISLAEIKTIEATHAEIDRYLLRQGDILLTEGGDPDKLGRGAVWQGEINPCIHQNHIFRVRPNPSYLLPDYLSALIGSARGKEYFLVAAKQTTGIASINMTQLSSFPALIPPIILQKRFSEIVQKQGALRQKLSAVNYQQNNCFNSLTQRAFRGEL